MCVIKGQTERRERERQCVCVCVMVEGSGILSSTSLTEAALNYNNIFHVNKMNLLKISAGEFNNNL